MSKKGKKSCYYCGVKINRSNSDSILIDTQSHYGFVKRCGECQRKKKGEIT